MRGRQVRPIDNGGLDLFQRILGADAECRG
jgi:hypothetical protein